jgi:hypothetical protein
LLFRTRSPASDRTPWIRSPDLDPLRAPDRFDVEAEAPARRHKPRTRNDPAPANRDGVVVTPKTQAGTGTGFSIGRPTMEPHSVQLPS